MEQDYGFKLKLDEDDWFQVGDSRFFEIEADTAQVKRFIQDNNLFKDSEDE